MKLWEVLKALEENPKRRFANTGGDGNMTMTLHQEYGFLEFAVTTCGEIKKWSIEETADLHDTDWQEVKTPVTWQEAIEAWANYKTIYCIDSDGKRWTYEWHNEKTKGLDALEDGIGVSPDEIKFGTWYIEEEE